MSKVHIGQEVTLVKKLTDRCYNWTDDIYPYLGCKVKITDVLTAAQVVDEGHQIGHKYLNEIIYYAHDFWFPAELIDFRANNIKLHKTILKSN